MAVERFLEEKIMATENTSLTPHLVCKNAAEAAEFYAKAFGAQILNLVKTPGGQVMHGALSIDGAMVFLVDEFPEMGCLGPQEGVASPVTLHLQVPDCDAVFNKAVEAGCTVTMPLELQFWGDRYGQVKDPYGHSWSIATNVKEVSPEELQKITASFGDGAACGPGN